MSAMTSGRYGNVPTIVMDDTRIGHAAFRVYAMLSSHGGGDGWCWPSLGALAKRLGISKQTVSKHIQELAKYGYVEIEERMYANGQQGANRYYLVHDYLGESRWQKGGQTDCDPLEGDRSERDRGRSQCDGDRSERDPIKNTTKEHSQRTNIDAGLFDRFKEAYPATPYWTDTGVEKALGKAIAAGADIELIIHAAGEYRQYCEAEDWHNPCGPRRWLDERRFMNSEPPIQAETPSPTVAPAQPDLPADKAAWWDEFRENVRKAKGDAWFKSWFAPLVYDGTAIWVPTSFMRDYLANTFNVPGEVAELFCGGIPVKVGQPPASEAAE